MLRKAIRVALPLVVAAAASVFCVGGAFAAAATTDDSVREFVVAYEPQAVNLDPLHTFTSIESQFYTAIYEGLMVADPSTLEPTAGVAARWDSTQGGKLYRFTLRSDARYSNGDPVRAQDFVGAWMRMIDPANNAEYSFLFDVIKGAHAYRTGQSKDPSTVGIKALSDSVLQVELDQPAAYFLKLLTHIAFLPLHPSLVNRTDWTNASTVIGNGPFLITSKSDQEIVLDKNPYYWDAVNLGIDRIRIRFIDDKTQATDQYLAGHIDWVTSGDIDTDKLGAQDRVEAFPMFGTTYFFFACDAAPWSDWRVRRALALLVPWDKVRTSDYVFPTDQMVPSIPGYPDVQGIDAQKVDEANKLLSDAGFPGGRGLPPLVVKLAKDSGASDLVNTMGAAWKTQIGLDVVIREVDPNTYFDATRTRDYGMGISTWIGDYADPLTFLQLWTSDSNLNDAHFADPGYDAAVAASSGIANPGDRYKKLADAETLLLSHAAVLPLYHRAAINLIALDRVGGWFSNPLDVHPFKFIKFKARATPPGITWVH